MLKRNFLPMYSVDVFPILPTMEIKTSLPQTATFSNYSNFENVVTSASVSLYNGETADCCITLTNTSTIPIEFLEISMQSVLDNTLQNKIFKWSEENIQSQLPILPNTSASLTLYLYGEADFLGPIASDIGNIGSNSLYSGSGLLNSGHASLPSRVSSPTNVGRRSELTSSFRSSNSGHSSLATLSLPQTNISRVISGHLAIRYSGGAGYAEGQCRQSALHINLELIPSVQITHWDVLPAEIPSQFYLVLDVLNLTTQEISLQYTSGKNILIEAQESCRVPVPVDRCPLDKMPQDLSISEPDSIIPYSYLHSIDRACSEHISGLVDLRWQLTALNTRGKASVKGISLDAHMLDLVRVAPLQWEVTINSQSLRPQEDYSCPAGQCVRVGVSIINHLPKSLPRLTLSVSFYQDHQNGINNYRLETRVASSGANKILLPPLLEQGKAHHECSVVFFTPGRYKADIQCSVPQTQYAGAMGDGPPVSPCLTTQLTQPAHVWRFIPPLEITVVD